MTESGIRRMSNVIGVVVGDGAPLMEIAIPLRIFTTDSGLPGPLPFEVIPVSEHDGATGTTAGIRLHAPHAPDALHRAGVVIVPGWRHPDGPPPSAAFLTALRRAHADGATIVGLCLGVFVLADAGLLDGRNATTHWRHLDTLADRHRTVNVVRNALYVEDGPMLTSAGGAAGLDACLHLLRRDHGTEIANAVSRALVTAPHRVGNQTQFLDRPIPLTDDDPVTAALTEALRRLDDPHLRMPELARLGHLSRRTFDRRFRQATGTSPLQWLDSQRVLHAQRLLQETNLGVDAVARRCGFPDAVALRSHFRRRVGVAPHTYRIAARDRSEQHGS